MDPHYTNLLFLLLVLGGLIAFQLTGSELRETGSKLEALDGDMRRELQVVRKGIETLRGMEVFHNDVVVLANVAKEIRREIHEGLCEQPEWITSLKKDLLQTREEVEKYRAELKQEQERISAAEQYRPKLRIPGTRGGGDG